jgi:hypothetical protein
MYCQECGKESQPGEVICSSCGGALTDAELDLPEVVAFPNSTRQGNSAQSILDAPATPLAPPPTVEEGAVAGPTMPVAPPLPEALVIDGTAQGPRLEVTVGGLAGAFTLSRPVTAIGRPDPASGHRPDIDLSMDAAVSRRHAEIRGGSGGYRIFDLGSTNGTIVNGSQIPRQQEVPLKDGDEIRVGENCKLVFRV